jgi:dolichol-phosphate mannosyltransferase
MSNAVINCRFYGGAFAYLVGFSLLFRYDSGGGGRFCRTGFYSKKILSIESDEYRSNVRADLAARVRCKENEITDRESMKFICHYPGLNEIFPPRSAEIEISVVIPVKNEAENIILLANEIFSIFTTDLLLKEKKFELICVNDASTDQTAAALTELWRKDDRVRIFSHSQSCGQSAALRTGILYARGALIVTLDGDGQNDPKDIPVLVTPFYQPETPQDLALTAGERLNRRDVASKKIASRLANYIRKKILNDGAQDTGCGLKAFHRGAFLLLPFFDHMHRYLPALFRREGFTVLYRPVSHRPRGGGVSNYGNLQRFAVGLIDLPCVLWLLKRKKPARVTVESSL